MTELIGSRMKVDGNEKEKASIILVSALYLLFGLIELLLFFRLVLKLMGAHANQFFVNVVYIESEIFLAPFRGIADEVRTTIFGDVGFFDPGIFIALAFYPLLCVGILKVSELLPLKFR